jgi:hypothetical protein
MNEQEQPMFEAFREATAEMDVERAEQFAAYLVGQVGPRRADVLTVEEVRAWLRIWEERP